MAVVQGVTALAPESSDLDLVAAVRHGSDRAFEELYDRYGARIRSYALGILGDFGRAEDVTQEAFLSALRRLRTTDAPIAFRPWIYEITRNACIDDLRRTRRRLTEVPLDPAPDSHPAGLPTAPSSEVEAENRQRLRDLSGAIHNLSASHHRVIVLRELEGRSYHQIGQELGLTRPMVESTLFRARRRLSHEYEELSSGRRCDRVVALIGQTEDRSLLDLGVRQRRQVVRHLSHCDSCRRAGRLAGLDDQLFAAPSWPRRLAGLVPWSLPFLRQRRGSGTPTPAASRSQHLTLAARPLEQMAPLIGATGPLSNAGRAFTAIVTMLAAAAGGSIAGGLNHGGAIGRPARPVLASPASVAAPPARGIRPAVPPAPVRSPAPSTPSISRTSSAPAHLPSAAVIRHAWSGEPGSKIRRIRSAQARTAPATPRAFRPAPDAGTSIGQSRVPVPQPAGFGRVTQVLTGVAERLRRIPVGGQLGSSATPLRQLERLRLTSVPPPPSSSRAGSKTG